MKFTVKGGIAVVGLSFAACAFAQGPPGGFGARGMRPGRFGFGTFAPELAFGISGRGAHTPVTGLPLTAAATVTIIRPSQNGQSEPNASDQGTVQLARDDQGRTWIQAILPVFGHANDGNNDGNGAATRQVIYINDPVARVSYVMYPDRKEAIQHNYPPPRTGAGSPPSSSGAHWAGSGGHRPTTTSLGQETIAGVPATGTERSTTFTPPAGAQNQQPATVTSKVWYSSNLHLVLEVQRENARGGQSTFEVQSLQQGPPNSSLFTVPSGYTVRVARAFRGKGPGGQGGGEE